MKLPEMKYGSGAIRRNINVFGGLNRRISAGDGELIHCENLGINDYPALSPRAGRGVYGTYADAADIFEWNGHTVIADGYKLLYDGEPVGNITAGKKQFAVVNTKLVVWPDKVWFDLSDRSFHRMDETVISSEAEASTYTGDSVTLSAANVSGLGKEKIVTVEYRYPDSTNDSYAYAKTYSTLTWSDGAWIGTDEAETEIEEGWTGKYVHLRANAVSGVYNLNIREEETFGPVGGNKETHETVSYSDNMDALCAEIVSAERSTAVAAPEALYVWTVSYRIVSEASVRALTDVFEIGDRVTLEGVPGSPRGKEHLITAIDDNTRKISFAAGSLELYGEYYHRLDISRDYGWHLFYYKSTLPASYDPDTGAAFPAKETVYGFKMPPLPSGSILYADGAIPGGSSSPVTITAWDSGTGKTIKIGSTVLASYIPGQYDVQAVELTFEAGSGVIPGLVKVSKGAPPMDFICAHNNRLYGVSNDANTLNEDGSRNEEYTTRIIYVSELGIPQHFTTFDGTDADSYQVAEASNGDFTGCISYGDHVLFFKEHKVVKFYGDYPSAMGFSYDDIEGVKRGCEKSMVIANEILYYMSRTGYCAYSGSVPQIISYKLDRDYDEVVCGTDGKKILLCGLTDEGHELLSYNIAEGIWLREDASEVKAMALINGQIHMAIGRKLIIDGGGDESVKWMAEFHPFTEQTFERKKWKYVRVRAEMESGAIIRVIAKIGDGEYETWHIAQNTGWQTITVPLPLNRTDRISLRLEGEGRVIVRDIERQYQRGSDR